MRFKKLFLVSVIGLFYMSLFAQIQPTPQNIDWKKGYVKKPNVIKIKGGKSANNQAVNLIKTIFNKAENAHFTIFIGEKADKVVRKFAKRVPNRPEGYFLAVQKNKIILVGNDERGTYYGVRTLLQLLKNNKIPLVEITDYPDVLYRGVVEGFYGTPWSFKDRMRQIEFYGENKLNTYIYGPKDDPYHSSPNWRKAYPEKEAIHIQKLVEKANENHVNFVWAIHPGKDIKWNEEDRQALLYKFKMMYNLGVRAFAVFFDDISGEGTKANKQAELLNFLDEEFVQKKKDVLPLIMCPTEYNKSWSNIKKGYLPTLGNTLNSSIKVMWTGDRVISDIDKQGLEWINKHIKRKAYIWWNFPVSDYVRDHLLMGKAYGLDVNNKGLMSGFMTNPMERAEASKIAIYSVADYAWNIQKYDSENAWKRGIKAVMPQHSNALTFFAKHNSDLGANGHKYRREESVDFQPIAKTYLKKLKEETLSDKEIKPVLAEFYKMMLTANILLESNENPMLIKEIKPWLQHFHLMGELGGATILLQQVIADNNEAEFTSIYNRIKILKEKMYEIDRTKNQNPYQPGVKTASLVVAPFIDDVLSMVIKKFNHKKGTSLATLTHFCPHSVFSNLKQLKEQPIRYARNWVHISPALEVVKYNTNSYFGIELESIESISEIRIDLGISSFPTWVRVEVSENKNDWFKIEGKVTKKGEWIAKLIDKRVKFIRLINTSKEGKEAYLKKFSVKL